MKNLVLSVLVAVVLALGVVLAVTTRRTNERQKEVQRLQAELEEKATQLEVIQAEHQRAEQQQKQLLQLSDELANRVKVQAAAAASNRPPTAAAEAGGKATADKGGFGKMLAGMMEDPQMKQFMRDQQKGMIDQLYSPLIAQMSLSPEEAARFKDLLADSMMKAAEKAGSLFGAATNRSEAMKQIAADQKAGEEQLRATLGESRYAQYQEYQQTMGERTQLNAFKQQAAGMQNPLTDAQTDQLLQFMKEEKQSVTSSMGLPSGGPGQEEANLQAMLSEDQSAKLLESQDVINQRVYDRASAVLSADQLAAFGKFQTNQAQMMRMGMSMARKFLAPEQPAPAPATK